METLQEILKRASTILDLEYSLPSGEELETRIGYANLAVSEAADYVKLPDLKREYLVYATTATLPLPGDFRELQRNPCSLDSSGAWIEYPEIEVEERYRVSSNSRYSYVLGNPKDGYYLYLNDFNGGTVSVIYQKYPSGFATLTDKCELSSSSYVVHKVVYYVLFARGDDKFPLAKTEAEKAVLNMVSRRGMTTGGQGKTVPITTTNPLG